jgi:hypothetical protein
MQKSLYFWNQLEILPFLPHKPHIVTNLFDLTKCRNQKVMTSTDEASGHKIV